MADYITKIRTAEGDKEIAAAKLTNVLSIEDGGTGAKNAEYARKNLGIDDAINKVAQDVQAALEEFSGQGVPIVVATSSDGVAYTATSKDVKELTNGSPLILIPAASSSSIEVTLNINDFGAKKIDQSVTSASGTIVPPANIDWLIANKPVLIIYDGEQWKTVSARSSAEDMLGTVKLENGGTGATTAEEARKNLGAAPAYASGVTPLEVGKSELKAGTLYFRYKTEAQTNV